MNKLNGNFPNWIKTKFYIDDLTYKNRVDILKKKVNDYKLSKY